MTTGKKIYDWIKARTDEGMTVYITTYTKSTSITKKHMEWALRVNGDHCEMVRGKNWDSINFCKITAA